MLKNSARQRSSHKSQKSTALCNVKTRSNSFECYEQLKGQQEQHPNVTAIMRAILFDWLFQVSEEFHFCRMTVYSAFRLVDKYIVKQSVEKEKLQAVGITALYLAHKVEYSQVVKLQNFVYATDNGFSKEQLMDVERQLLECLRWKLSHQTLPYFLDEITYQWDFWVVGTWLYFLQFRNEKPTSLENHRRLYQTMDYMILYQQSNDWDALRLALALLYCYLKYHNAINDENDTQQLFNVKSQPKIMSEIFNRFLQYHYAIKLTSFRPEVDFVRKRTYGMLQRRRARSGIWRPYDNNEPYEKYLSYQSYCPSNLEMFKMGRQLEG